MTQIRDYFTALVTHETALWNAIDSRLVAHGNLTLGRLLYLRAVGTDEGSRLQEISTQLGITLSAASRLTDRLVASELVERVPHPTDRRSALVRMTDTGRRAHRASERRFDDVLGDLLRDIDPVAIEVLTDGLWRVNGQALQ